MVLPFALNHINLWLLRDELVRDDGSRAQGWTIVDCGIANDATRSAWERIFERELDGLPVLRVVVTHMHPDHMGLAHWLADRWGARVWMSATDFNAARLASSGLAPFGGPRTADFMARHGLVDPGAREQIAGRTRYYAGLVPDVPTSYRRLMGGDRVALGSGAGRTDWACLAGYGHAPEHISLHCPALGLLIAGDMLLPRISTNVSVLDQEPEANPLPLYLASLQRLTPLPADTLVLPSHGKPFTGLHPRVAQLQQHHEERLQDVLQACAEEPRHAAALLPELFRRPLDLHQTTFAMGEAGAHLHALWLDGRLRREAGADGVWRFTTA
jgi:glyoxylase-like metal-dependent hydrolase (beta-lactamase superfamily II)